jgi:hypothetical protein
MSTFRTPVGPQPGNVYWRRRLLVLLGLLVVILIVILIIARPSGTPKPTGTKTPTPTPGTTNSALANCTAAGLDVKATTDSQSYAAGVDPMLSLTITNTGTTDCTFKVGSDVQDYEITSGTEKIWSSKDCQTNPVPVTATLKPGVPVQSTPFSWDRTRSDPAKCNVKNKPKVVAGGASYHLKVTVNGVSSAKSRQFVLR